MLFGYVARELLTKNNAKSGDIGTDLGLINEKSSLHVRNSFCSFFDVPSLKKQKFFTSCSILYLSDQ